MATEVEPLTPADDRGRAIPTPQLTATLIAGDHEYRSEEALPQLKHIHRFLANALELVPEIGAIAAVAIHTIGALGKMFSEVVENADMRPDEGLRAAGASLPIRMPAS